MAGDTGGGILLVCWARPTNLIRGGGAMDVVVGAVIVTGALVLLAVIAVLVLSGPLRLRLRGPFRAGLDVKSSPLEGVRLIRVRAGRNLRAKGTRVEVRGARAGQDATF
jgi:hypothetical protein